MLSQFTFNCNKWSFCLWLNLCHSLVTLFSLCFLFSCLYSYGVTVISKEFPSTRRLPRIASEASGSIWVPPEMMTRHPAAEQGDVAKLLKVLCCISYCLDLF